MQTREVYCGAKTNVSITVPIKRCDRSSRLETRRQCSNEQCVAIWKTSKWTKVSHLWYMYKFAKITK